MAVADPKLFTMDGDGHKLSETFLGFKWDWW